MNKNYKSIAFITAVSIGTSVFAQRISNPTGGNITTPIEQDFTNLSGNLSGGGIQNNGTISTITNCTFTGNSTEFWGGAIANASGTINKIIDSTFIGNSSEYGGAIENSNGNIGDIVDSSFTGNTGDIGGAISNYEGTIGISAKNKDVIFTGNSDTNGLNSLANDSSTFNLNAYGGNRIVVNDGVIGNADFRNDNKVEINNGIDGLGNPVSDVDGITFGLVEINSEIGNNIVNVNGGAMRLGSYAGETVDVNGTSKTFGPSIASIVNSDITVDDDAIMIISTNSDNDAVVVDENSELTVSGVAIFESNASLDIKGNFTVSNATLFLEFGSFEEISEDDSLDGNWVIATFDDAETAKAAMAGFTSFGNDLGIPKNDGTTANWYNVQQSGNSIEVIGGIPEPATLGLIGFAGAGLAAFRRRFKK